MRRAIRRKGSILKEASGRPKKEKDHCEIPTTRRPKEKEDQS
jgi:hypothetical protein